MFYGGFHWYRDEHGEVYIWSKYSDPTPASRFDFGDIWGSVLRYCRARHSR